MPPSKGRERTEVNRIWRILEMIRVIASEPSRHLRRDLAKKFKVSERTIQNDLDTIRYGFKLEIEHSPGGYCFEAIPRLDLLACTFPEALALYMAAQTVRQDPNFRSEDLATAVARLETLFPEDFLPYLQKLNPRLN